jgi:hypothetical protein
MLASVAPIVPDRRNLVNTQNASKAKENASGF